MLKDYTIEDVAYYGCIYKLTSPSGKCYIGQSWKIKSRLSVYLHLGVGILRQTKLYNALKKYEPKNFRFEIIDLCETQIEMDNKEIFYIELYDSINSGYNIREGGSRGKLSAETKEKLSKAHTGGRHSVESKEKMSKSQTGRKHSKETKDKIGKTHKNKIISDEIREKIGNNSLGRHHSNETKEKLRIATKTRILSAEMRQKISKKIRESNKNRKPTKESIEKRRTAICKTLYEIITPNNEIILTKFLSKYCKDNNLHSGAMYDVAIGKYKHHKQYKVKKLV